MEPGRATLMEWDDAGLPPSPVPTFLYALPFPDGSVFVEETVLVARPPVPFEPLEAGMHVLSGLAAEARRQGKAQLIGNLSMFYAIAGTRRLRRMLADGRDGAAIIAAWQDDVARFKARRAPYLLYE